MNGRIQQAATGESAEQGTTRAEAEYQLKIATDAITKIATATAREVKGLHLTESRPGILTRLRSGGRSSPDGGIRASLNTHHEVALALSMTADYGVHIPTLAADLRGLLAERIQRMTDFRTRSVQIEVLDVLVPEETDGSLATET